VRSSSNRVAGLILAILGLAVLVLKAVDYLFGWNQVNSALFAIGITLVVVGAGLARHVPHTG
jgi:multisubunit Na+/H+ antiporter MnhB subunit